MPFHQSTLFSPRYEPPCNHFIGKPLQTNGFGPNPKIIHLPISGGTSPIVVNAYVEWKETPVAHVYKAHVPGLRHDEVRVEVENGRELCIIGEKLVERETKNGRGNLVERVRGRFIQSFILPENANVNRVKAYMDNGALVISVPKY
ncbi:18.1 kDa class I heat shock protein-like [Cajanus cajan]|uniref:18.1 kDa class I heat shock protein-like n=1 Tax=Cajanus cajan TaxID=3821 RepID=UPI00098DD478|nr:18.1 kDa class I heat shock protein-like [Cajanus cajan]